MIDQHLFITYLCWCILAIILASTFQFTRETDECPHGWRWNECPECYDK